MKTFYNLGKIKKEIVGINIAWDEAGKIRKGKVETVDVEKMEVGVRTDKNRIKRFKMKDILV